MSVADGAEIYRLPSSSSSCSRRSFIGRCRRRGEWYGLLSLVGMPRIVDGLFVLTCFVSAMGCHLRCVNRFKTLRGGQLAQFDYPSEPTLPGIQALCSPRSSCLDKYSAAAMSEPAELVLWQLIVDLLLAFHRR